VSPDEDVIAEPGVTLTMEFPGTTQGDIVEHHAPVTDYRGFADDDAGAMIEEEATPNARGGVDLDTSPEPIEDGQEPREQSEPEPLAEPVGHAVKDDRVERRVAEEGLQPTARGRIVPVHRTNVVKDELHHGSPP
jgi:hypothetical protein